MRASAIFASILAGVFAFFATLCLFLFARDYSPTAPIPVAWWVLLSLALLSALLSIVTALEARTIWRNVRRARNLHRARLILSARRADEGGN